MSGDRNDYGLPGMRAEHGGTISGRITYIINHPLPWFVLITIIAVSGFWIAWDYRNASDSRVALAEARAQDAITIATARAEASEAKAQAAIEQARIAEREARMGQYYLIEVDGKLIRLGVQPPEGGYMKFREKHLREGAP